MSTLKLTMAELEDIVSGNNDRFEEVFYGIPLDYPGYIREPGETHSEYVEDDGREYRWYVFNDTETGIEHCVNVVYHPEWPVEVSPESSDTIEIVSESVL